MSEVTAADLARIDAAEAASFAALFAAARPELGTGTQPLGATLAMWHPREDEAGYSYLLNFHLAADPEATLAAGESLLRAHGAPIIGIPVEARNAAWGTEQRLAALGLAYESDEVIWAAPLPEPPGDVPAPAGIELVSEGIDPAELAQVINVAWDLPPDHTRGMLYASSLRIPEWYVLGARLDGRLVGATVASFYEGVCYLKLAMVLPEARGRGLQTAFIARRLAEGRRRGCDLAISETNDDNASPRNLGRAGLRKAIHRRVYAKPLR